MRITQEQFTTLLKNETGYFKKYSHDLLNAVGKLLPKLLSQATEDEPVEVFICPGVKLVAKHTKPRSLKDPRNGEPLEVEARILVSAGFTRKFKQDVNAIYSGTEIGEEVENVGEDLEEDVE